MRRVSLFKLFAVAVLVLGMALPAAAYSFTSGYDASATLSGGVRYKSLSNSDGDREVYVGVPDLGVAATRNEMELNWGAENEFSIGYDPTTGVLTTQVGNYDPLSYTIGAFLPLNYLQVTLSSRQDVASVALNNIWINGTSVGSFSGSGWQDWYTYGSFSGGFSMTGVLSLSGVQPLSSEKNKAEFKLG